MSNPNWRHALSGSPPPSRWRRRDGAVDHDGQAASVDSAATCPRTSVASFGVAFAGPGIESGLIGGGDK